MGLLLRREGAVDQRDMGIRGHDPAAVNGGIVRQGAVDDIRRAPEVVDPAAPVVDAGIARDCAVDQVDDCAVIKYTAAITSGIGVSRDGTVIQCQRFVVTMMINSRPRVGSHGTAGAEFAVPNG